MAKKRSKYARKLKRKQGSGKVDPRWMWWFQDPEAPPRQHMSFEEVRRG